MALLQLIALVALAALGCLVELARADAIADMHNRPQEAKVKSRHRHYGLLRKGYHNHRPNTKFRQSLFRRRTVGADRARVGASPLAEFTTPTASRQVVATVRAPYRRGGKAYERDIHLPRSFVDGVQRGAHAEVNGLTHARVIQNHGTARRFVVIGHPFTGVAEVQQWLDKHKDVVCHGAIFHSDGCMFSKKAKGLIPPDACAVKASNPARAVEALWKGVVPGWHAVGFVLFSDHLHFTKADEVILGDKSIRKIIVHRADIISVDMQVKQRAVHDLRGTSPGDLHHATLGHTHDEDHHGMERAEWYMNKARSYRLRGREEKGTMWAWRAAKSGGAAGAQKRVMLDPGHLLEFQAGYEEWYDEVRKKLQRTGQTPLEISYADLVSDEKMKEVARSLEDFLGVDKHQRGGTMFDRGLDRQNNPFRATPLPDRVANWGDVLAGLEGSPAGVRMLEAAAEAVFAAQGEKEAHDYAKAAKKVSKKVDRATEGEIRKEHGETALVAKDKYGLNSKGKWKRQA